MNKRRLFSLLLALVGLIVLSFVFLPIINYQLQVREKYPNLVSPVVESKNDETEFANLDYTHASSWFYGGAESAEFNLSKVQFYTLSIPKLDIENVTVALGGEDLSESLIQYPGTAAPGKNGNSVIFGHSVLPIFYDPKDYLAIFSTLPTLEKGDEIFIDHDGIRYKYIVESMFEVTPFDIQILEQDVSDSYLSLVTCVPPGDPRKPKRLIVRAKIVPINGETNKTK